MKRILCTSLLVITVYIFPQNIVIQNKTKYPLNVKYSQFHKPVRWPAFSLPKKVKVLPGKTVELGDAKKTIISNVGVMRTSALGIKPKIDYSSLKKALNVVRDYNKDFITLEFTADEKVHKVFVTAVQEELRGTGMQTLEPLHYTLRPVAED
jgi:hypothetical protein